MYDLVIRNCHAVIPADKSGHSIQENCDILVNQGKIVEIRSTSLTACPREGVGAVNAHKIIEANEMLAMPGLINTHAHAPMVIFRGLAEDVSIERWFNEFMWPLESNLTEEDVYWGMLLALVEMIEGGVTTVADHYFFMNHAAQAVEEAGTRAALGWATFADRGYDVLEQTAVFAEKWQGKANGRLTTWMAPHAPYTCNDDFLKASVAYAKRLGIGIHIHASEEMGQTKASLTSRGKTPIQVLADTGILDLPTIIAHGCGLLPEDIELLKQANQVGIAPCP